MCCDRRQNATKNKSNKTALPTDVVTACFAFSVAAYALKSSHIYHAADGGDTTMLVNVFCMYACIVVPTTSQMRLLM